MSENVKVGRVDPTKRTSEINGNSEETLNTDTPTEAAQAGCLYNGVRYSVGSRICADGTFLYCEVDGTWSPGGSC